jgi:integrase
MASIRDLRKVRPSFSGKKPWEVRYRSPAGESTGKTFATLQGARSFANSVETDKERNQYIDPKGARKPFDEVARNWLDSRHNVGDSKRAKLESILRRHVIGEGKHGFGRTPIGRIDQPAVQGWVNFMVKTGYAPSYIRSAYSILSGVLRSAASAKLIGEAPLVGVELPKPRRKRERFLNEQEIDRLVSEFDPFYRPLILTAPWSGCRWGELAGLHRADLDLDKRRLHVRWVVTQERDKETGKLRDVLKPYPKSDAGRRTIGLSHFVVEALRDHLDRAPESDLVFTTKSGAMLHGHNFARHWKPAVRGAGLEPLTFHDLRHTHVALLIKYGWQEFQIVRRLGWSDSKMLHAVYGHLFPNHDAELVADLEDQRRSALEAPNVIDLRTIGGEK